MGKVHSEIGASNVQGGRSFTVEDRSDDFEIPPNARVENYSGEDIPENEIVNPYAKRQHFANQLPPQPQSAAQRQWEAQQAGMYQRPQPAYPPPQQAPQGYPAPQMYQRPTTTEEAMSLRRQMIGQGHGAIAEDAKQRIEALIGLGRGRRDVPVDDGELRVVFTLRTLKGKEQRELISLTHHLQESKNPAEIYDLRHAALKHSLFAIDGIPIDQFLGIHQYTPEDRVAARHKFIENMDETTISVLFRNYEELMQENLNRHLPKSDAQVKEVVDQITKSGPTA